MLSAYCDRCGHRLLLTAGDVLGLRSDADGTGRVVHVLTFRCYAGHLCSQRILGPPTAGAGTRTPTREPRNDRV